MDIFTCGEEISKLAVKAVNHSSQSATNLSIYYGKDIYNIIRSFENLKTKYEKTKLDIQYIKLCKQERLLPTFATIKLSRQTKNNKLKERIGRIIMEHE